MTTDQTEAPIKLEVKNLYKVFGAKPQKAMQMLKEGKDKDEIFAKTGQTVGVKDANLSIREGEIFVIMGLSGSGKSTLVRLLNRLIEPTHGQVLIDGEDVAAMDQHQLRAVRRKKISMVFQSFALMPHMNVLDNAAYGLELSGEPVNLRHQKAQAALEQVGLGQHGNSYPDELSGGMQQRVGLARALANDPDVMLMDEAFSALDPLIRTEMQDELVKLQQNDQRTIVFISHDLDEAMRIGDRIAIMQNGEVVQVGTPNEILNNPANDYVSSFFKNVDVSNVFTAATLVEGCDDELPEIVAGCSAESASAAIESSNSDYAAVVDADKQFIGIVSAEELASDQCDQLQQAVDTSTNVITADTPIKALIGTVASSDHPIPVTDENGNYLGSISKARLLEALDREEDDAQ
ncbi:glycine betaine/L-proline ABC transporter ATP-binding protein ProV [Oceanobacter kriegii]|uniref:glycine betaine/L-proline ABC transporter ATP-binding protein ProV n=1 Tax=Oceanobacter kriegii TaxID=64972 RepID=UPI000406264B|nr:glycine betaine/L-proline ABC transporter ATP-binding protein ProV [Oceanobacter kriegii]